MRKSVPGRGTSLGGREEASAAGGKGDTVRLGTRSGEMATARALGSVLRQWEAFQEENDTFRCPFSRGRRLPGA